MYVTVPCAHGLGFFTCFVSDWPASIRTPGEWKDDQRNGSGVRKYPDGSLFKGEWKDTPFFGRGVCEGGALKYRRLLERVRKGEKWCHRFHIFHRSIALQDRFTKRMTRFVVSQSCVNDRLHGWAQTWIWSLFAAMQWAPCAPPLRFCAIARSVLCGHGC